MTQARQTPGWLAPCLVLCACGPGAEISASDAGPDGTVVDAPSPCAGGVEVRVVVLDAWGRRLPSWEVTLTAGGVVVEAAHGRDPTVLLEAPLAAAASADGFLPATVEVRPDPGTPDGLSLRVSSGPAWTAVSRATGRPCGVTCYVGLDHAWFASSGRPFRDGNQVDLLMDGEAFWTA